MSSQSPETSCGEEGVEYVLCIFMLGARYCNVAADSGVTSSGSPRRPVLVLRCFPLAPMPAYLGLTPRAL